MDETSATITPWQFHAEPGTGGWHVLYGGAQALFPTSSFAEGAALLARVVEVTRDLGREPDVDLRPRAVVVVTARDARGRLDRVDAEVARRVSAAAAALGLEPDPAQLQTVQIAVADSPGHDSLPFFRAVLGYAQVEDVAADPLRRWPRLWSDEIDRSGRGRTHIDVSVPHDLAVDRVARAVSAGGRIAKNANPPHWWMLASPDNHGVDVAAWGDIAGGPDGE